MPTAGITADLTGVSLLGRAGSLSLGCYFGRRSDKFVRKFFNDDDLAKSHGALEK